MTVDAGPIIDEALATTGAICALYNSGLLDGLDECGCHDMACDHPSHLVAQIGTTLAYIATVVPKLSLQLEVEAAFLLDAADTRVSAGPADWPPCPSCGHGQPVHKRGCPVTARRPGS